ncbi:hypothetical protein SAMN04488540_109104 [Ferrimonas sediminum]|uniref:Uncharacterized protein n=1 Tax=Ferrimonas sediminum TaxID=718193 RepID=A0A1G8UIW5_9GAMM|nr:hypothetical protein [Ferrimonas sediminum]SDJ53711.1 hypothetical protein SAMN04488540_109104 [Ferrimonas sediminum]
MRETLLTGFILCVLTLSVQAYAELPEAEFTDQFGYPCHLGQEVTWLLFAHDKAGSHLAMKALESTGALSDPDGRYLVDTSAIPGWVASWFVLPKLRELPYAVCLDPQGVTAGLLAGEPGEVQVYRLHRRQPLQQQGFSRLPALERHLRLLIATSPEAKPLLQ